MGTGCSVADSAGRRCDKALLEAIATGEAERVLAADREWMGRHIPQLVCSLCGLWPVVVWLETAKELGVRGIKVLKYANSGDVPAIGDKQQVIGYGLRKLNRPPQLTKDLIDRAADAYFVEL